MDQFIQKKSHIDFNSHFEHKNIKNSKSPIEKTSIFFIQSQRATFESAKNYAQNNPHTGPAHIPTEVQPPQQGVSRVRAAPVSTAAPVRAISFIRCLLTTDIRLVSACTWPRYSPG